MPLRSVRPCIQKCTEAQPFGVDGLLGHKRKSNVGSTSAAGSMPNIYHCVCGEEKRPVAWEGAEKSHPYPYLLTNGKNCNKIPVVLINLCI